METLYTLAAETVANQPQPQTDIILVVLPYLIPALALVLVALITAIFQFSKNKADVHESEAAASKSNAEASDITIKYLREEIAAIRQEKHEAELEFDRKLNKLEADLNTIILDRDSKAREINELHKQFDIERSGWEKERKQYESELAHQRQENANLVANLAASPPVSVEDLADIQQQKENQS